MEERNSEEYINFKDSNNVWVLIQTKPGQKKLEESLNLKFKAKNIYFLLPII